MKLTSTSNFLKYSLVLIPTISVLGFANEAQAILSFSQFNNPSAFVDISSTGTVVGSFGDDQVINITTTVGNSIFSAGTVGVSSNGNIQSGSNNTSFSNQTLPTSNFATALLPFWDDLLPPSGGNIYWQESQINGINALIVQWDDIYHISANGGSNTPLNFQVQVFQTGSTLARFAYNNVIVGDSKLDNGASATIGYQASSLDGTQFSFNSPVLANGDVVEITSVPFEFSPTLGIILSLGIFGVPTIKKKLKSSDSSLE